MARKRLKLASPVGSPKSVTHVVMSTSDSSPDVLDSALAHAMTMVYDYAYMRLHELIGNRSELDLRARWVRMLCALPCVDREMSRMGWMGVDVAACVYYHWRCTHPLLMKMSYVHFPYDGLPSILSMTEPPPDTTICQRDGAVGKFARVGCMYPHEFYERSCFYTKGVLHPLSSFSLSAMDGLMARLEILEKDGTNGPKGAPPCVQAFVCANRSRAVRDMERVTKGTFACIHRKCGRRFTRLVPSHIETSDGRVPDRRALVDLILGSATVPYPDRDVGYWDLLSIGTALSIGEHSFCCHTCMTQWLHKMRCVLPFDQKLMCCDESDLLLEDQSEDTPRIHAIVTVLTKRNLHISRLCTELRKQIENDRSKTCVRKRDINLLLDVGMEMLNVDTTIAIMLQIDAAKNLAGHRLSPNRTAPELGEPGWRCRLSHDRVRALVNRANHLLYMRRCDHHRDLTSILYKNDDVNDMQRLYRQYLRSVSEQKRLR